MCIKISIVGKQNSGKTTLIEKLIKELIKRGYRVGTIKHNIHGFEIDHRGKDSYRHKKAGAAAVVISSAKQLALVKDIDNELTIDEIKKAYLSDMDIILTEGYKKEKKPKIEIYRKEAGHGELLCQNDSNLIALVVNDDSKRVDNVPIVDLDDILGLVNLIETKYLKR